jgi:hypothetical protein
MAVNASPMSAAKLSETQRFVFESFSDADLRRHLATPV